MEKIPVDRLKNEFSDVVDCFSGSLAPEPELVRYGLYPPLPICGERLIWGFHIVKTAEESGIHDLFCRRVELDSLEQLRVALKLENRTGRYSFKEKACFYHYLQQEQCMDRSSEIVPLVDIHGSFVEQIKQFTRLPALLKEMVDEHLIDIKSASKVQSLPEPVLSLLRYTRQNLSFSSRRMILQWLFEIGQRDNLVPEELAERASTIVNSDNPTSTAESMRFPTLRSLQEEFEQFKQRYIRHSGVELKHPPYFEGETFRIEIPFDSIRQLEKRLSVAQRVREHGDELFKLV